MTLSNIEVIRTELEKFYATYNIDTNKLVEKYETDLGEKNGYICICGFCLNATTRRCDNPRGIRECC